MKSSKESRFVATGIDRQWAFMYIERKPCPYMIIGMNHGVEGGSRANECRRWVIANAEGP